MPIDFLFNYANDILDVINLLLIVSIPVLMLMIVINIVDIIRARSKATDESNLGQLGIRDDALYKERSQAPSDDKP